MRFRDFYFLSEAKEGDRAGIQHLYSAHEPEKYSMGVENFREFISFLQKNGGLISPENSSVSEKIDGMALKVGNDSNGFYIRSSYSGKGYSPEHFKNTIKFPAAQAAFVNSFDKLKTLLGPIIKNRHCEVQLEWLYSPNALGVKDSPEQVTFAVAKYQTQKLGSWSTFVVLDVVCDRDADVIKRSILSLSDEDTKFMLPNVEAFHPINLQQETKQASLALQEILPHQEQLKKHQGSMKRIDVAIRKQARAAIQDKLLPIQKAIYDKISSNLLKVEGILGEIEGYVIKAGEFTFKVNSPHFMSAKFQK